MCLKQISTHSHIEKIGFAFIPADSEIPQLPIQKDDREIAFVYNFNPANPLIL
jgi:hypothetical protein